MEPKAHYRIHKSPPPVPVQYQIISPGSKPCEMFRKIVIYFR